MKPITDPDLLEICSIVSGDDLKEAASQEYEHVEYKLNPAEVRLIEILVKVQGRLDRLKFMETPRPEPPLGLGYP